MNEIKYSAFISYRHVRPDSTVAKHLIRMLETYRIPRAIRKKTGIKKLKKVFRDRDELPLSSNLGQDIHTALHNSDWFIALCSPDYLESEWCMEELNYYINTEKKKDRILTMLVNGSSAESFPEQLKRKEENGEMVESEPLAAHVVAPTERKTLRLLKQEKLRILAPILGVSYDELRRRDRERKLKRGIAVSLAAAVLAAAFGLFAMNRAQVIEHERRIAAGNEVQLLSEKSVNLTLEDDRRSAMEYALQAYEVSDTIDGEYREDARTALSAACYSADFTRLHKIDNNSQRIYSGVYSPDDSLFAGITNYDSVSVFDTATGGMLYTTGVPEYLDKIAFSPDGSKLLALYTGSNALLVYDSRSGQQLAAYTSGGSYMWHLMDAFFVSDDRLVIIDTETVRYFNLSTLESESVWEPGWPGGAYLSPYAIDTEHSLLAMLSQDGSGRLGILDYETGNTLIIDTGLEGYGMSSAAFSPDGDRLAVEILGNVFVVDPRSGQLLASSYQPKKGFSLGQFSDCSVFSPDGSKILVKYSEKITAFDSQTGRRLYESDISGSNEGGSIFFLEGGRYFYTDDFASVIFDTESGSVVRDLRGRELSIAAAANSGGELIMNSGNMSLGVHNMIGRGSQRLEKNYTGEIFSVDGFGEIKNGQSLENQYLESANGPMAGLYPERMYVSPNGRFAVLTNNGGYIKIWDTDVSSRVLYRCAEHSMGGISLCPALAFSADSRYFATAGYDGRCTVFDLEKGRTLRVLSPCANMAAVTSIISYADGTSETRYLGEYSKDYAVLGGVTFNADASLLMLATETTGEYFVYNINNGAMLYRLYADGEVEDFGFDAETGDAVIKYTDGSALTATIFSDDESLLEYAESIK